MRPITPGLPGPGVPSSEWPRTLLPWIADPSLAVIENRVSPLLQFGFENLGREAKRAGVDGVLITDLIPEEAAEIKATLQAHGLDLIYLVAPTSTDERLKLIALGASGFIYAVSRAGVTGAREQMSAEAESLVNRVRNFSDLPVAVGFGISTAEQAREVAQVADAVVVGSAIVKRIGENATAPDLPARIAEFVSPLAAAAKSH